MLTLQMVKAKQPYWFNRPNMKFFGDVSYQVRLGKYSGKQYIVVSTYAFSDLLGGPRVLHYRIHEVDDEGKIGSLIDKVFSSRKEITEWLKTH